MEGATFPTLDALATGIQTFDQDIEKLYAIYYYICHNIIYNVPLSQMDGHYPPIVDDIFETKTCVCDGYSLLFRELVKRSQIRDFHVYCYINLTKGHGYDKLSPPSKPIPNHAAVCVVYQCHKFLSEPTWEAGYIDQNVFIFRYNPEWFLRPLVCCLNDHFPHGQSNKAVHCYYPYEFFVRTPEYHGDKTQLRAESHPFLRFDCETGLLDMQFSCLNYVQTYFAQLYKKQGNK
jgi:hypothetical protein